MKTRLILLLVFVFVVFSSSEGQAGGPWDIITRGAGKIHFTRALPDDNGALQTVDAHLSWNFKLNRNTGEIHGYLNIFEKPPDGSRQRFRLSSDQVNTEGNPEDRPFQTAFNCSPDVRSVQLVGQTRDGFDIVVVFDHLRASVSYLIIDVLNPGPPLADTGGLIPLDGHMDLDCDDKGTNGSPDGTWTTLNQGPTKLYLPVITSAK